MAHPTGKHKSECRIATLLACEADKLLSMSRLPMDQIGPFVDAGDPSLQTRDQVRARVAKWLGATPPARAGLRRPQPSATHQPTFFDELFAACTEEDERSWRINIGMRAQDADQKSRLAAAIRAICAIDEIATRIDTGAGQHLVLASALRTEAEKLEKIRRQS